jgi:cation transport ATPase
VKQVVVKQPEMVQGMGVVVRMLTGDTAGPAKAIAASTGVHANKVHASLLPGDKLQQVSK